MENGMETGFTEGVAEGFFFFFFFFFFSVEVSGFRVKVHMLDSASIKPQWYGKKA